MRHVLLLSMTLSKRKDFDGILTFLPSSPFHKYGSFTKRSPRPQPKVEA